MAHDKMNDVVVLVAPDKTMASCKIRPTAVSEKAEYSFEEIVAELKTHGVVFGIREEKIQELLDSPRGETVIVAQGTPAVDGENAKLDYQFDLGKLSPKELEDGKVDFYELGLVKNVVAGQILVKRTPPSVGSPGISVMGTPIVPKIGKDKALPAGKNTSISDDGLEIIADCEGHVFIRNNKVTVERKFVINGHADLSTGNIRFLGEILIRGNIMDGLKVQAQDNIEVMGSIQGAAVESTDGSIKVHHSIAGRNLARIKAGKNITARFIENATLDAGNDIVVQEHILHSKIQCKNRVVISGDPGVLAGGEVVTIQGVEAKQIGNETFAKTRIWVHNFVAGPIIKQLEHLKKDRSEIRIKLSPCTQALEELRGLMGREDFLANKRKEELLPLAEQYKELKLKLKPIEEEIAILEKQIPVPDEPPYVQALGNIYPGVTVLIDEEELVVKNKLTAKRVCMINEKIAIRSAKKR